MYDPIDVEDGIVEELSRRNYRSVPKGEFHPSKVTGCTLKGVLDKATGNSATQNSWMFQGTAVHYYLQESGILDEALNKAGFHPVHTSYEVSTQKEISDDVTLVGTCDILASDGEDITIFDIKYSTVKTDGTDEKIYQYFAQVNTYAHMFDASSYGLIVINSMSGDLLGEEPGNTPDITVLSGEPKQSNWEDVKERAISMHETLDELGYEGHKMVEPEEIASDKDAFETIFERLDESQMPAFEGECKYCDHSDYCPVYQDEMNSGFNKFVGGYGD